jgi:hypothetical protein
MALAQHDGAVGSAPPPPPGSGQLTVRVILEANPDEAAGLSLALYALAPDGTPGLAQGVTGPDGSYTFEGISTDPGIVYLIGARYRDIPYGERVTFEPDSTTAQVELEVAPPTDRVEGVEIEELRARLDWMGDRVVVRENLRLVNPGDRVILLEESANRSIVTRPLPAVASDFSAGPTSIREGLAFEDGRVRFRGPLYPGEQEVEYVYSLPVPRDVRALDLPVELSGPAGRVVIVAGTPGVEATGAGLVESSPVVSEGGQSLAAWAQAGLDAGERIDIDVTLPESRIDPGLISIPRGDVWLEMDDTRLTATVDLQLRVAPGPPVTGSPSAPLFHVSIPAGATLNGVAPEAERLGLVPTDDGGFDVIGPIGPDETSLGFSYRMPARPEGLDLDLRFPRDVETLNVLIADTGVALASHRLHRRRPFRSGTRNYLHREAFNVTPSEGVDLSLVPLQATGLSRTTSQALALVAVAAATFFLITPLRTGSRRSQERPPSAAPIRAEREAVYATIADLDHDFETGKLEQADYQQMRDAARAQAIELLRAEREAAATRRSDETASTPPPTETRSEPSPGKPASTAPAQPTPPAAPRPPSLEMPTTHAFCPACGGKVASDWRYCTHCGGRLNPSTDTARA